MSMPVIPRMLPRVQAARFCCPDLIGLAHYRPWTVGEVIEEIHKIWGRVRGLRICQINSTASGGGVAEMLSSLVPLYSTLAITTDWRLTVGDDGFLSATKTFHNAIQGAQLTFSGAAGADHLEHNRCSAEQLDGASRSAAVSLQEDRRCQCE